MRSKGDPVLQWIATVATVGCDLRGLPPLSHLPLLLGQQQHCMLLLRLDLSRALCLRLANLQHQATVRRRSSAIRRLPRLQLRKAKPRFQQVLEQKQQ